MSETSAPVLMINGGQDDMVRVQHAYRLKDASQNPDSQLWIVPEAQYGNSYLVRPADNTEQVVSFIGEAPN